MIFQPLSIKHFKPSPLTTVNHLKLYAGYIKKTNEIMARLHEANPDLRALKTELSFALNGVKNHEMYFDHLGGQGGEPQGLLAQVIKETWGSFANWQADLKATALVARGWVWLAYDWRFHHWFNYLGDAQNTYPVWENSVAVALDVYEHAYWAEYGPDRAAYIDDFFKHLDWSVIERNVTNWGLP